MTQHIDAKQIAKTFLDSLADKHSQHDQIETVKQFVAFLVQNNLLSHSGKLVEAIQEEMIKRSGQTTVQMENSGDLSEEDIENIRKTAASLLGETVNMDQETSKKLLGGIKMKIANKVIDATIKRRLEQLSKNIKQ